MLKLKDVLAEIDAPQAELARAVELSQAAIAQLINHSQWPKSLNRGALQERIAQFLAQRGANDDAIGAAFDEVEPRRANAEAPASPTENDQVNDQECDNMLMAKQVLTPAARKQFGLFRDPLDELQDAGDMYVSPDIRYVRECMHQVARHDGFLAVIGESGAGKSTLRRDLHNRLAAENAPVVVIEPYIVAMEDNDVKGKTLKSTHIAEAVMAAIAPLEKTRSTPEGRFSQMHNALKTSHAAGNRHVLIIEEAHSLPIPTLKQLKRLRELEVGGFTKLISIILIGQPELAIKLSPRNGEVREVAQRIEIVELPPVSIGAVEQHLAFRFGRADKPLQEVISPCGVQAIIQRLSSSGRDKTSQLYPLAMANLVKASMNLAAQIGEPLVTADVVNGV
ncbi:TPA: transposase [Pseudomonas aeruginosa]|uniref:AAA family ATPase n=1 Tax=Pseudomonas aeruginosa TaxID=287 RepID=UPI0009376D50|nr:AAA family ATPase [Pseudomonas aeruginosa]RCM51472.1 putative secretion ATPase, PEP-CTERM locus subfamily [Pseudomonas aeruginosa]HBP5712228.1 transposase [Pseudomonas aeruginosa]HCT4763192.1 AAA family ATPase [Pseudomonas aeruginosa]HDZ6692560.1 AAA family ATPase [Pseudomonas aeruginosa]